MQPEYRASARGAIVSGALADLRLSQAQAIRRLANRTSSAFVSMWCTGRRAIPQWAAQALASELRSQAARLETRARELESIASPGRSANGHTALAAWRQRRAAQKEKARE